METFTYETLNLDRPAFRLLRLIKGDGPVIQGEIFQAWLDQPEDIIPYEALSYTWGFQEFTDGIEVNGQVLGITSNLYLALQHLRFPDQDRILWVDAISIDQGNLKERGHQVQQMGHIYKQAQRVIVWLGQATYETNVIMDYLRELQKKSTKHVCKTWMPTDSRWRDLWTEVASTLQKKHPGSRDLLSKGLQILLDRRWFSRVWILQEVANATSALVYCGTRSIQARIFILAPHLIKVTVKDHCQSVLDIMPSAARGSSWWSESQDFHTLLKKFWSSEAHDPRDMIYALLGMSSDAGDSPLLRPDYELSEKELIVNVISFLSARGITALAQSSIIRDFLRQFSPSTHSNVRAKFTGPVELPLPWNEDAGIWGVSVLQLIRTDRLDIELKDIWGSTPLAQAALGGQESLVRLLLGMGANIEAKDDYGQTPLLWAIHGRHEGVVRLLLKNGAQIESRDQWGQTPLFWAIQRGDNSIARLLIEKGAGVESIDEDGQTPLVWAVRGEWEYLVTLLIESGSDVNARDFNGLTPLYWAIKNGNMAIKTLLLDEASDGGSNDDDSQ